MDTTLQDKRILVTGASGFLGSLLLPYLLREGAKVAGLSRSSPDPRAGGYTFLQCDLCDPLATRDAFSSFVPDIVFHLASHADRTESYTQAVESIRGNLQAVLNTLEAFRLCGGSVFIYGDSCKVYGDSAVPYRESTPMQPLSSYAICKAAGWEMCRLYRRVHGMCTVSVRPTIIYGPQQPFNLITYVVDAVLENRSEVPLDGGSQTRDPLYVDDAMEAFVAVARHGHDLSGRIVNISGGYELSVTELAREVVRVMNSRVPVVPMPGRVRLTDTQRSYCDNVEAKELIAWSPKTSLRTGLERTVAWLVATMRGTVGRELAIGSEKCNVVSP